MHAMSVPEWWTDIERARLDALNSYSRVLDGIERVLEAPADLRPGARYRLAENWTLLLQQEKNASQRLASVLKLGESRIRDALRAGLDIPAHTRMISDITGSCQKRSRALRVHIKETMDTVLVDLSRPQTRRPKTRSFQDSRSSLINLQA